MSPPPNVVSTESAEDVTAHRDGFLRPVVLQRTHPEAQSLDEEWAGVASPQVRRRLQNRLNQRGSRRRKAFAASEGQLSSRAERMLGVADVMMDADDHRQPRTLPEKWNLPQAVDMTLGQGRVDPFNIYPIKDLPMYVHEVLDHAFHITWPGVSPSGPDLRENPVKTAWLQCAMNSSMAFFGFVFAAGLHHTYLNGGQAPDRQSSLLQLSYQTQAIKLINKTLRTREVTPSDTLLVSILILAAHGPKQRARPDLEPCHPPSPLARAQNLDFYGSLLFVPAHLDALYVLVGQKGGLDAIELHGLADTIAFGELVGHTVSQSAPVFPSRWKIASSISTDDDDGDDDGGADGRYATYGFSRSESTIYIDDLLMAIAQARAVTDALTRYHEDHPSAPPLIDIIRSRNAVQHRLLSLPAFDGLLGPADALYEACRLSALIYSEMVLFPFPAVAGVKPKLATRLRRALDCCTLHQCWDHHPRVMLWIATCGGIAATGTGDRAWYVRKNKLCLDQWPVKDCSHYLACMRRYLWWDYVCEEPARRLWEEARTQTSSVPYRQKMRSEEKYERP